MSAGATPGAGRATARTAHPQEDGQVLLLILGYSLIVFVLLTVVVSATSVHLARTRLTNLADAAALDAADSLDEPVYYAGSGAGAGAGSEATPPAQPLAGAVPLSDATVRGAVEDYLAVTPVSPSLEGLAIGTPTGAPDTRTAEVTLTARIRPPLMTSVLSAWSGGIPLRVTARARASALE